MSAAEEESWPMIQKIAREIVAEHGKCNTVQVQRIVGKRYETSVIFRALAHDGALAVDWTDGGLYTTFRAKEAKVAQ